MHDGGVAVTKANRHVDHVTGAEEEQVAIGADGGAKRITRMPRAASTSGSVINGRSIKSSISRPLRFFRSRRTREPLPHGSDGEGY